MVGFPLMVIAVGLGLGPLFESYPVLHQGLKIAAFVYLLYLAWRIATAGRHDAEKGSNGRPLSFLAALAFQWVNPKAWAMALGSVPLFTTPEGDHVLEIGRLAVIFAIVTLPCVAAWCLFGNAISGLLHDETRLRWFNIGMAVLLVASVVPTLF